MPSAINVNGYTVYIHRQGSNQPLVNDHVNIITEGNIASHISCLGVDCYSCPIGIDIRIKAFGVTNMNGSGCTECANIILQRLNHIYRRPPSC